MVNRTILKRAFVHLYKNPLISGSAVIFIGSFVANLLSYFFNLLLGRFLTVSDYGTYATLISVLGLFGIFPSAFTQIFAKFSAVYKAKGDVGKTKTLFVLGFRVIVVFATVLLLILTLSIFNIASFLHISDVFLLLLVFFAIFLSIIGSLPVGVLQGELRVYTLALVSISTPLFKIIIGFILLFLGLQVFGVTLAIITSSLLTMSILFIVFRSNFTNQKITKTNQSLFLREFKKYSFRFFLAALGITILTGIDMIFVKHFFSPVQAGQYAALSLMGRSIFYITAPIYAVFFPLIAQKQERNENIHSTLLLAISIITIGTVVLSFVYFLFPTLILNVFYPAPEYKELIKYLGPFSLYIIIFSIAMLFNSFLLSIGKASVYKINLLVAGIFIVLMYVFHNSFYQLIGVLFFTALLLLVSQVLYYLSTIYGKK